MTSSLEVKRYRIVPTGGMVKEFNGSVSLVKVISGTYPGARIHWEAPTAQNYTGQASELLVNGSTYIAPNGKADRFWITSPNPAPTAPQDLELQAYNCVNPVVVLNPAPRGGFFVHLVNQQNDALLEVAEGEVTYYVDARPVGSELDSTTANVALGRAFIGGAITGASIGGTELRVILWQRVKATSETYWAELARFPINVADSAGRFSAVFENGGMVRFNASMASWGAGPVLLPWPANGLKVTVQAIGGDFSTIEFNLYERIPA